MQRHSSFEHALMGDVGPSGLGRIVVSERERDHVLQQAISRINFFLGDVGARGAPERFPDVRWIRLRASDLDLTYGELNALADYLPNADQIDTLPRDVVGPVLQRMRRTMRAQFHERLSFWARLDTPNPDVQSGAARSISSDLIGVLSGDAGEVEALDSATQCLCSQRYKGLLARNACHFSPANWHRFARFHEEARGLARRAYQANGRAIGLDADSGAAELARQAWIQNGYGDHFLQDSFAAGHLINKTMIMQWFVEWLQPLAAADSWVLGQMPSADVLSGMTVDQQPNIAGQSQYAGVGSSVPTTASDDRARGSGATDPQTAEERTDRWRRVRGSGVRAAGGRTREQNYQLYLQMLNNSFIQGATSHVHDHFNRIGLEVENDLGGRYRVGGDNTLIEQSNQTGAMLASQASHNSQRSILSILAGEEPSFSTPEILQVVPTKVVVASSGGASSAVPLDQWHDGALRELCFETLFHEYFMAVKGMFLQQWDGQQLLPGGASQDTGAGPSVDDAPDPNDRMGDFPVPDQLVAFG